MKPKLQSKKRIIGLSPKYAYAPREADDIIPGEDNADVSTEEMVALKYRVDAIWGHYLSGSEHRVLCFIGNRTLRYRKIWERISMRDFVHGIPKSIYRNIFADLIENYDRTMRRLDPTTQGLVRDSEIYLIGPVGFSESNIKAALKSLHRKGFIRKAVYTNYTEYAVSPTPFFDTDELYSERAKRYRAIRRGKRW